MGRLVSVIWLVLVVAVLMLLGQSLALFDVPLLRDLSALMPLQRVPEAPRNAPPLTVTAKPLVVASPTSVVSGICSSAAPRFEHGAAALKAAIGVDMGEPVECERVIDAAGNSEQKTTKGLAYYRAGSNTPAFTNGFDHWALTAAGVVHWLGDELEPPPGAELAR